MLSSRERLTSGPMGSQLDSRYAALVTALWSNDGAGWGLLSPAGFPDEATLHRLVEDAPQLLPLSELLSWWWLVARCHSAGDTPISSQSRHLAALP